MADLAFRISPSTTLIAQSISSSSQMNLTFNPPLTVKFATYACLHSKTPSSNFRISASRKLPARDRLIDFGKYKGRMLGSLPSNYLQWVSKNLRARDFEEWAKLADEVLTDPVYRDRIEWEFAEKVLNGNGLAASSRGSAAGDSVSELLEISERFGWDNNDKAAWSKIDFGLLGTSNGGRIPRAEAGKGSGGGEIGSEEREESVGGLGEDEGRRRERRERLKQRRVGKGSTSSAAVGTTVRSGRGEGKEQRGGGGERGMGPVPSPFPGREALLKKVLNRERLI